jgi:hypothetical protein
MWIEVIVASFEILVLFRQLPGGTGENYEESKNSRSLSRELNPLLYKYEATALTICDGDDRWCLAVGLDCSY